MKLEQLRYLIEVAKTGSIGIAASNLYMTQPAISKSLKHLETELGVTLISRSHTGAQLTEVGEAIIDYAQQILSLTEKLQRTTQKYQAQKSTNYQGPIYISAMPSIVNGPLANMLAQLSETFPQITFTVIEQMLLEGLHAIVQNSCDLAFLMTVATPSEFQERFLATENCALEIMHLKQENCYIIAKDTHPLCQYSSVSLKDIKKYPLAIPVAESNDNWDVGSIFERINPPNIKLKTNNWNLITQEILKGSAITVVTHSAISSGLIPHTKLIPVSGNFTINTYAVYKKTVKEPLIQEIISTYQKQFGISNPIN